MYQEISVMKKITILLFSVLVFCGCNRDQVDPIEENYDELFPFEGIEPHEDEEGEIVVRNESPDITKKTFKYKGEEGIYDPTTYDVVLKYRFDDKNFVQDMSSRYFVRFVNEKKELVSISSIESTHFMDPAEYAELNGAPVQPYEMYCGKDYEIKFQVQSGHQLLLCVNGFGPRNTAMKASITATPLDDSTVPIVLETEQYQNDEGHVSLPYPYCKYVVLP